MMLVVVLNVMLLIVCETTCPFVVAQSGVVVRVLEKATVESWYPINAPVQSVGRVPTRASL